MSNNDQSDDSHIAPEPVVPSTALWDVAIIGAGPVGLAAAIEAKRQGLRYVVLEKGCVVNAIFGYPTYMTFFTSAEFLEIGGHPLVSLRDKPDRREALAYYRLVTSRECLHVRQYCEVVRLHPAPAGITVEAESKDGELELIEARYVLAATGYFDSPNKIDALGQELPNVAYHYTEAHPFFGLRVTVIGGGNSAADAALDLYRHGAQVTLIHRGPDLRKTIKYWVKPDIENRIKEGSIVAHFNTVVTEIGDGVLLARKDDEFGSQEIKIPSDFTFILAGYQPDTTLYTEAGIVVDADGCIPHHPTFETIDVPGLYVVGSAAFGRFTNQVFIENGREHALIAVRDIARQIKNRQLHLEPLVLTQ
jgi:thioredoxin reductase (NADPH)